MKIYNLLFYSAYNIAKRSSQYGYAPVFFASLLTLVCIGLNIILIHILVDIFVGINMAQILPSFAAFIIIVSSIGFVTAYYKYNNRYIKIIQNINKYLNSKSKTIFCWCILCSYYAISMGLLFIAAIVLR